MNDKIKERIEAKFLKLFKEKPLITRSPGRVNIIGEHTDYNEGFVLPAAIDKAVYVGLTPRIDEEIHLYSFEFDDSFQTSLKALKPVSQLWPNYILGIVAQMVKSKYQVKGFNLVIDGDIPIGSGLSSSAAVECATAFALNQAFGLGISKLDLALMGQKAEHEFAGVKSGIMDQFASVFGKKDHAIRLDCRSLEYKYVPLKLNGYRIVLLNTNVKHALASSEYNTRRQQCEAGVEMVQSHHPQVHSLRDVNMEMLDKYVKPADEIIYARCRYVVEENERLHLAFDDLVNGDLVSLGKRMYQTHDGLSKEYAVSCPELDFLVDAVRNNPSVPGARMMGGGFGGCTINIVQEDRVDQLIHDISAAYKKNRNKELSAYIAKTDDGTSVMG